MLILTVIRVLIDSVVRPQNNSALECPCCLDYLRLCCNSPFNLLCFKIGESHSAMKCGKCLMRWGNPDCHSHGKLSLWSDHQFYQRLSASCCGASVSRRQREEKQSDGDQIWKTSQIRSWSRKQQKSAGSFCFSALICTSSVCLHLQLKRPKPRRRFHTQRFKASASRSFMPSVSCLCATCQ